MGTPVLSEIERERLTRLMDRWQVAVGLRCQPTATLVESAVETLTTWPTVSAHPIEAALMRGCLLELATALRASARVMPAEMQRHTHALCDALTASTSMTMEIRMKAAALVRELRAYRTGEDSALASRARASLDAVTARMRTVEVARLAGTNVRYVTRAFKQRFGVTVAQHQREHLAHVILLHAEAGERIKEIAHETHCSESTVRRLVRRATGTTIRQWKRRPTS